MTCSDRSRPRADSMRARVRSRLSAARVSDSRREPIDEFRLARRRGGKGGGGAVLRLLMGRRGVGQPLLQRGERGCVFRYGDVVPSLKRGEVRLRGRQFRGVPPVGIQPRRFGGGQLPFKAEASVRFVREPVFERSLTRRGRGQILCCTLQRMLLRRLRFGQRAFERCPRGSRFCQSSAQLRFHTGELPGGRGRFRCALPTGSLEGGRGFGRLPLECGAGGGVFLQRGVVSRLKFRSSSAACRRSAS